jgi:hypothetical protein
VRTLIGCLEGGYTIDELLEDFPTLKSLDFSVIVLHAGSNKIEDLRPLIPKILAALASAEPGRVAVID